MTMLDLLFGPVNMAFHGNEVDNLMVSAGCRISYIVQSLWLKLSLVHFAMPHQTSLEQLTFLDDTEYLALLSRL